MVLLKPAKTFTNNKFPLGRLSGDLTCGAPTLTQPNWELKVSFSQSQALWRKNILGRKLFEVKRGSSQGANCGMATRTTWTTCYSLPSKAKPERKPKTNYITVSLSTRGVATWPISPVITTSLRSRSLKSWSTIRTTLVKYTVLRRTFFWDSFFGFGDIFLFLFWKNFTFWKSWSLPGGGPLSFQAQRSSPCRAPSPVC